jgi:hypothetical protein
LKSKRRGEERRGEEGRGEGMGVGVVNAKGQEANLGTYSFAFDEKRPRDFDTDMISIYENNENEARIEC